MKKRMIAVGSIVIATLFIICVAVISAPWRYRPVHRQMDITKEEFLQKMAKLDEKYETAIFSENGEILFQVAEEKEWDKYLIPAIFCQETVGGRFTKGDFNYWNAIEYVEVESKKATEDSYSRVKSQFVNFETSEQSIERLSEILNKDYGECKTYLDFLQRWAPNTAEYPHQADEYAKNLYLLVKQIEDL